MSNFSCKYCIEPFFLPLGQQSLFCVYTFPTDTPPQGGILYLPPFAEEMHKSRRMAALQARQFAQAGYAVLQFDLLGCGDSSGEFAEANWRLWMECAKAAHTWLSQQLHSTIYLWGLRLGAIMATELSSQVTNIGGLILWQPVTNGETFLNQFLRIKVASEMLAPTQEKSGTKELLNLLESGQSVEIGGYMLAPELAMQLKELRLGQLSLTSSPIVWLESSPTESQSLPPASSRLIENWIANGMDVRGKMVLGDNFWSSQEILESPNLLLETSRMLGNIAP